MNYLGYLVILGYFMFGLIVICSIAFSTWTFINKDTRVVRASQPMFLGMICCGTLIMAASIIPLTVDDQRYSERGADIACMSVPWLIVRKLLFVVYHWMNHILSHTVHCTVFLLVDWLYHDIFGSIQQDLASE
jgi:hypothetical protein